VCLFRLLYVHSRLTPYNKNSIAVIKFKLLLQLKHISVQFVMKVSVSISDEPGASAFKYEDSFLFTI
jgi:hypothetical protein